MNTPTPPRPATLHDVAEAAGVSLITASRALGNPSIVSEKTRERVRQAVEATGYIPNLLAGGLKSNRKSTRLNSSHSQISYAVFCLKKKKNKNITSQPAA